MAQQMKTARDEHAKLMGGETMNSAKFIELAGPAAEGRIASTPGAALESRPGGKAFADKYKARFNQDIGLYAPYFYDGVMADRRGDEGGQFDRSGEVSAGACEDQLQGRHRRHRVRRAWRPDARSR